MADSKHFSGSKPPVRIGLLMNSYRINYSYYHIIESLVNSGYAEVTLVVLNKKEKKITAGKIFNNLNNLFFQLYQRIDSKLFKPKHNVLNTKDSSTLLKNVAVIETDPLTKNYFQWIPEEDILKIQEHKIDVFIRMGFKILKGPILNSSRHGVWSYHHADNKVNRGGPPGFWEMFYENPVTGVIIQVLSEDLDNGKVLSKTFGATHKYSLYGNRNSMYAKGMFLLPRLVENLYQHPEKFVTITDSFPEIYNHPLYTGPTNFQVLQFLLKIIPNAVYKSLRQVFYRNQWFLLYGFTKNQTPQSSMRKLKKLFPPKNTFWADPHVIFRNANYYIFLEEKFFNASKAHITVLTMDEKGKVINSQKALELPYHLSYPFIFSYNGSDYMIPETSANKTIELYKCEEFPAKWKLEKVLMKDIVAVDCTLHEHDGKWWMFFNSVSHPAVSKNDELYIYYADTPFGPWKAHQQNPVISDVTRARPAGSLFRYGNKTYRPSQDCSVTYGYGIRINEILELTTENYSEKETDFIEPLWDDSIHGVHSFAFINNLTLIDGFRKIAKWN